MFKSKNLLFFTLLLFFLISCKNNNDIDIEKEEENILEAAEKFMTHIGSYKIAALNEDYSYMDENSKEMKKVFEHRNYIMKTYFEDFLNDGNYILLRKNAISENDGEVYLYCTFETDPETVFEWETMRMLLKKEEGEWIVTHAWGFEESLLQYYLTRESLEKVVESVDLDAGDQDDESIKRYIEVLKELEFDLSEENLQAMEEEHKDRIKYADFEEILKSKQ